MGLFDSLLAHVLPQKQPDVSLAQSRLSHGPVLIANNPDQFHKAVGDVMGISVRGPQEMNPASPMAGMVRDIQAGKNPVYGPSVAGQTVTILPKWSNNPTEVPGKPGKPGFENTDMHEAIHQSLGTKSFDVFSQVSPTIRQKVRAALPGSSYSDAAILDEIPARLGSGQAATLGLNPTEAKQLWDAWQGAYAANNPDQSKRLAAWSGPAAPQAVQ